MLTKEITIDLDKNYINKIKLHKGDTDVLLKVKLIDNYGQVSLANTTIILNCKDVYEIFKVEDDIATIIIPQIVTAKVDGVVADLEVFDRESKYSTAKIIFVVEDTVENVDIIASPEYKAFETLMNEVHEFMKNDAIVGATGATGPTGPQGPEGKGLYELAIEELGWTGTRKELIDSFAGPEGPQGPQGDTGEIGPTGPTGADGKSVNIWYGTLAEYNSIVEKDENTIYLIRD